MSQHLWIDADACPVTDIAVRTAAACGWQCTLICDTAHVFSRTDARVITVDQGADSADLALVNRLSPGDVVVTQDYGLAALCLARQAHALNQNGQVYTAENIGGLLHSRYEGKKLRRAGGHLRGPRKRTAAEDAAFAQALRRLLESL